MNSANQFSSLLPSDAPDTRSTADTDSNATRKFSYGLASLFSIMLLLVVTLGVMLWAH